MAWVIWPIKPGERRRRIIHTYFRLPLAKRSIRLDMIIHSPTPLVSILFNLNATLIRNTQLLDSCPSSCQITFSSIIKHNVCIRICNMQRFAAHFFIERTMLFLCISLVYSEVWKFLTYFSPDTFFFKLLPMYFLKPKNVLLIIW